METRPGTITEDLASEGDGEFLECECGDLFVGGGGGPSLFSGRASGRPASTMGA